MPRKKRLLGAHLNLLTDLDPLIAQRRVELAAEDKKLRKSTDTVTMESLLDWQHRHPYGLGETAGNGLTTKIRFLAPGEVESYTGDDVSPYSV
jgi:hypothetical protein